MTKSLAGIRNILLLTGLACAPVLGFANSGHGERSTATISSSTGEAMLLAQAGSAGKQPMRTLKAAYVTSLSFSPLFRAIEKGYLKDENIAMKLELVRSVSTATAYLGRGQLDLGFGSFSDSLLNAMLRGVEVKVVASMSYYAKDPAVLASAPILVRKQLWDSGEIRKLADLKGKKVAFNSKGGIVSYIVSKALGRSGLTVDDLDIVQMRFPDQMVALANGAIAASVLVEPLATAARSKGTAIVLEKNPAPGSMATVLIFGKNLLVDDEAPTAKAVLRALRRAANELQSPEAIMSDENLAIWSKYTKIPAKTIKTTAPYMFARDLAIDVDNLMDQQNYQFKSGNIAKEIHLEGLIDSRYTIRAH